MSTATDIATTTWSGFFDNTTLVNELNWQKYFGNLVKNGTDRPLPLLNNIDRSSYEGGFQPHMQSDKSITVDNGSAFYNSIGIYQQYSYSPITFSALGVNDVDRLAYLKIDGTAVKIRELKNLYPDSATALANLYSFYADHMVDGVPIFYQIGNNVYDLRRFVSPPINPSEYARYQSFNCIYSSSATPIITSRYIGGMAGYSSNSNVYLQAYGGFGYNLTISSGCIASNLDIFQTPGCSNEPTRITITNNKSSDININLSRSYGAVVLDYVWAREWTGSTYYYTKTLTAGESVTFILTPVQSIANPYDGVKFTYAISSASSSGGDIDPDTVYTKAEVNTLLNAKADSTDLASYAPLASPALSGTPTAPTAAKSTDSTQIATTAFVHDVADDYAPLASPTLTGSPTAPTQTVSDDSTKIATTAFVHDAIEDGTSGLAPLASPSLTGTPTAPTAAKETNTTQIATTAFVKDVVADYAPKASPALTGNPTAPTQNTSDDSTKIATTAFVHDVVDALDISSYAKKASPALSGTPTAPTAAKATDTTQIATTEFVHDVVADYVPKASPVFTGTPTAPTPSAGNNSTQIATTAFVENKLSNADLYVDYNTGSDTTGTGTLESPYKTIQKAINMAAYGPLTTINIDPGSYDETISVSGKNIILTGITNSEITIRGIYATKGACLVVKGRFRISSSSYSALTISEFGSVYYDPISVSDNLSIYNSRDTSGVGILVESGGKFVTDGNVYIEANYAVQFYAVYLRYGGFASFGTELTCKAKTATQYTYVFKVEQSVAMHDGISSASTYMYYSTVTNGILLPDTI